MANRNRNNVKIETTIEGCRSEAKWQRVIELAEELKTGSPNYGMCVGCDTIDNNFMYANF